MAELSIRRGSFLVSDQFIDSISRELINVTQNQTCVRPLSLFKRGSLLMAKSLYRLIVSILWTGVELVL